MTEKYYTVVDCECGKRTVMENEKRFSCGKCGNNLYSNMSFSISRQSQDTYRHHCNVLYCDKLIYEDSLCNKCGTHLPPWSEIEAAIAEYKKAISTDNIGGTEMEPKYVVRCQCGHLQVAEKGVEHIACGVCNKKIVDDDGVEHNDLYIHTEENIRYICSCGLFARDCELTGKEECCRCEQILPSLQTIESLLSGSAIPDPSHDVAINASGPPRNLKKEIADCYYNNPAWKTQQEFCKPGEAIPQERNEWPERKFAALEEAEKIVTRISMGLFLLINADTRNLMTESALRDTFTEIHEKLCALSRMLYDIGAAFTDVLKAWKEDHKDVMEKE